MGITSYLDFNHINKYLIMNSTYQELKINSLELDINNPRISQYLDMYGGNITAEGIALALSGSATDGSTTFSALRESIRVNRGIIHPIIVNHTSDGKYTVIEGNTRLQIYRDFFVRTGDSIWETIRCIVYENLSKAQIDSIRLQSHMVGPRDWDAYSKAKYLNQLYHEEGLPINTIIDYCGGKKSEIIRLIDAYNDIQRYYVPLLDGDRPDPREFSKFSELQNKSIKNALNASGYTEKDFSQWVLDHNIDTAMNVRLLPEILADPAAKKEFLKTTISDAIRKLNTSSPQTVDLKNIGYDELTKALIGKLRNILWEEVKALRDEDNATAQKRKGLLEELKSELDDLLANIEGL